MTDSIPSYCDFCGGGLREYNRTETRYDLYSGKPSRVLITTIQCTEWEEHSDHFHQVIVEKLNQLGEYNARP
jgi:hypothetical protein